MFLNFVKVAVASPKLKVAACESNAKSIIKEIKTASENDVSVLVFPELCVTTSSCGNLFLNFDLISKAEAAINLIRASTENTKMLVFVGFPFRNNGLLYNCAAAIFDGEIVAIIPKGKADANPCFTPYTGDYDEVFFLNEIVPFSKRILLKNLNNEDLVIAAEIGDEADLPISPSCEAAIEGSTIIVNLSASNELVSKAEFRRDLFATMSKKLHCAYLYSGIGAGESTTDLVFSGHSLIAENGHILAESVPFEQQMLITEIDLDRIIHDRMKTNFCSVSGEYIIRTISLENQESIALTRNISQFPFIPSDEAKRTKRCEQILRMQGAALETRILHTGVKKLVLGVSGGLDSCLALLVCVTTFDRLKFDRKDIKAFSMPCFGTSNHTKSNAKKLCNALGVDFSEIDITAAVKQHLKDIELAEDDYCAAFENSQARERTQVLMDIANKIGAIVVGTGDLSELALGFATYNGDHMAMYGVNASVPKTLIYHIVRTFADKTDDLTKNILYSILSTPVSPELLPPKNGEISQKTEDLVGPYELHDFFLYYLIRYGFSKEKIEFITNFSFKDKYTGTQIQKFLTIFYRRFISQQFKRSCSPDAPKIGSVSLSPRGDWLMPSDMSCENWL